MELLQLKPGMLIWSLVTFFLLLIVLRRIAWGPLLNAVEARENRIAESLEKAESAQQNAEKLLAEQQEKLAAAQEEMQQLVKEGKQVAEKMKNDIVEQARDEAQKIKERAKADIDRERETMIASLKTEVAEIVFDATSKLIGVVVDKNKHQNIIDDSIANMGQKN